MGCSRVWLRLHNSYALDIFRPDTQEARRWSREGVAGPEAALW